MRPHSDEELVDLYRSHAGTPEGQGYINELFERYYQRVGLWCVRYTGNRDRAADLAQEVFAKVYQNIESFRGASKFSTWLYTVTRNHCWNDLKVRRPKEADDSETILSGLPDFSASAFEQNLEAAQMAGVLKEIMDRELTRLESQIMTLHYVEELPLAAITRLFSLENASGAKAHIVSAKRKIAEGVRRWRNRSIPAESHGERKRHER